MLQAANAWKHLASHRMVGQLHCYFDDIPHERGLQVLSPDHPPAVANELIRQIVGDTSNAKHIHKMKTQLTKKAPNSTSGVSIKVQEYSYCSHTVTSYSAVFSWQKGSTYVQVACNHHQPPRSTTYKTWPPSPPQGAPRFLRVLPVYHKTLSSADLLQSRNSWTSNLRPVVKWKHIWVPNATPFGCQRWSFIEWLFLLI